MSFCRDKNKGRLLCHSPKGKPRPLLTSILTTDRMCSPAITVTPIINKGRSLRNGFLPGENALLHEDILTKASRRASWKNESERIRLTKESETRCNSRQSLIEHKSSSLLSMAISNSSMRGEWRGGIAPPRSHRTGRD